MTILDPTASRSSKWCYFTPHFSFFEVERVRLGEVVSLVGDCRPPPPGNPRRPASSEYSGQGSEKAWTRHGITSAGRIFITPNCKNYGGEYLILWKRCSFNNLRKRNNLKKLNNLQYFKKNGSYFSCTWTKHVLKFSCLHSHLCGLRGVESPSIAITNVLGM